MLCPVYPYTKQGSPMGLSSASHQRLQPNPYKLAPSSDPDDDASGRAKRAERTKAAHEELPFVVELWSVNKKSIEQVLAVTARGSIGYAAYYAAVREYPDRYVTLRHKDGIVAQSNGPNH
jgi:hypothetical protein